MVRAKVYRNKMHRFGSFLDSYLFDLCKNRIVRRKMNDPFCHYLHFSRTFTEYSAFSLLHPSFLPEFNLALKRTRNGQRNRRKNGQKNGRETDKNDFT